MLRNIIIFSIIFSIAQTLVLPEKAVEQKNEPPALPLCVWYRSAPFCGNGNDCPTQYPYLEYQASSSGDATYCPKTFGSQCWSGQKNLCCGPTNVYLQDTGSYTCGSDFKKSN